MLILCIDEEPITASYLRTILPDGFDLLPVFDSGSVIDILARQNLDFVLLDIEFDRGRGIDLIKLITDYQGPIPVVVHSRSTRVQDVVASMKLGAYQYLPKLVKRKTLINLLLQCQVLQKNVEPNHCLEIENEIGFVISGCSHKTDLEKMLQYLHFGTVFLNGESGTGKLLLAKHLHERYRMIEKPNEVSAGSFFTYSGRDRSFEMQWEDLFGAENVISERDSGFPGIFEKLKWGTVYIEEIGNLCLGIQTALCQMLETGLTTRFHGKSMIPVHCHLIIGSVLGVSAGESTDSILPQLMDRLKHCKVELKPLRNRQQDLISLAWFYLRKASQDFPTASARNFHPSVLDHLVKNSWPGNITELRNSIFAAVKNCKGEVIRVTDFAS